MLSERQLNILHLLINIYTDTDYPVGSKTLMNAGIKASSATIRNDLAKLEDEGYIKKTHSSSGRIPSIKGYRYYVDHLMTPVRVSPSEQHLIRESLGKNVNAISDIVEQSAKILSDLTSYTAFSLGPEMKERKLTGFRIIPLNANQLIAVIVTDRGNVESQVFTIPESISSSDIEKITAIINDKLIGEHLLTVYHKLRTEIPIILQRYFNNSANVMVLFENVFESVFEEQLFISGKMNLLDFDILSDVSQFKSIYSFISDREELTELLIPKNEGIEIKIGKELQNKLLENMSLITASYEVTNHGRGVIALLGPTNMSYSRLMGVVDAFRTELTHQLLAYYHILDSPVNES
ncbi:heat-inducible transcriptional repressor HrcA [Vagococcus acidifermentans]|uniref:Heat-inducible transcription repressor HrcA n=1 Tax=Vagococcus acidifermentans TaxID=564710 RepID=A0A430B0F7_9ENTE|nr:heat-inducible transcriptional repressor HrcA [Vagococcus acidifermentans]RSU13789.1 heat-inducible transcriptional repressor HrcA [Vagococcus acidifermentans]